MDEGWWEKKRGNERNVGRDKKRGMERIGGAERQKSESATHPRSTRKLRRPGRPPPRGIYSPLRACTKYNLWHNPWRFGLPQWIGPHLEGSRCAHSRV